MSRVFDAYARYYDLLYSDKNYVAEARYVTERIRAHSPGAKRIFELGSGTGAHAEQLARLGYEVHGVDFSETMVGRANGRIARLPPEFAQRLSFSHGDLRTVRVDRKYEVAIALFHVMSYQTSNADLDAALATAHESLEPGGLFFFDFWYGPAVLTQKPDVRVKRLEDDAVRIVRIAEPVLHASRNVVDVKFTVFVEEKSSGEVRQIRETHPMRYLFLPELQMLASPRFEFLDATAWMASTEPGIGDWAGCVALRRRD